MNGVASITVTYNPELETGVLRRQLVKLGEQSIRRIIVDNNSINIDLLEDEIMSIDKDITLIKLDKNLGIAAALNVGIEFCVRNYIADWILTLDQDSEFMVDTLSTIEKEIEPFKVDDSIAAFGLNFSDIHFSRSKETNSTTSPVFVKFLITSGCLVRCAIARKYKFDEELFMYHVDTDFCHRITRDGYKLVLLSRSKMIHRGGSRRFISPGKVIHFNEPFRFFFMARNSIVMLKRYGEIKGFIYTMSLLYENFLGNHKVKESVYEFLKGCWVGIQNII